jgi:hypothetical protein
MGYSVLRRLHIKKEKKLVLPAFVAELISDAARRCGLTCSLCTNVVLDRSIYCMQQQNNNTWDSNVVPHRSTV